MHKPLPVELPTINTLLACAYVLILVFEVESRDMVDFSFENQLLRIAKKSSLAVSRAAGYALGGNAAEHKIIY